MSERATSQNFTEIEPFRWTAQREQAALLLADDTLTDEQIAARAGVTRRTLATWKLQPDFAARVQAHVETIRAAILEEGIADKTRRVQRLNRDWERMQQVIDARGADPEMQDVPGGKTGLLVRQVKGIGHGENFQRIDEYAVDTGLLAELRQIEQQAAKELGQWLDKQEVSGKDGQPVTVKVEYISDEERAERIAKLLNRARERRDRQKAMTASP